MKRAALVLTVLLTTSETVAQGARYQGRTLDQWLAQPTQSKPVSDLIGIRPHLYGALGTLGPRSPRAKEALDLLAASLSVPSQTPYPASWYLGAFGDAGAAILRKHIAAAADPETLAGAVARAGKAGVAIVLANMRTRPGKKSEWIAGCRHGSAEFFAELKTRLSGANRDTKRDILACLSSRAITIGTTSTVARSSRGGASSGTGSAPHLNRQIQPKALLPVLHRLAKGKLEEEQDRQRLLIMVRRSIPHWSAAQSSNVPLLLDCLRSGDDLAIRVASMLLGEIGSAAESARPELLTSARDTHQTQAIRLTCLLAAWKIRAPNGEGVGQLHRLFGEVGGDRRFRAVARSLMSELGSAGIPFMRAALADEQLRADTLDALETLGPRAKTALADVEALATSGTSLLRAAKAIAAIDPSRWITIEHRMLELARDTAGNPSRAAQAKRALLTHGHPAGVVLDFFAELYRDPTSSSSDRRQLQDHLLKGGAFDVLVAELIKGKLDLTIGGSRIDDSLVDGLCGSGRLAPAAAWLRKRIKAAVKARKNPLLFVGCGTRVIQVEPVLARLLGASGTKHRKFLTTLSKHKDVVVRVWGFAGLGQMAHSDPVARGHLVDELVRLTGGATGTAVTPEPERGPEPPTQHVGPSSPGSAFRLTVPFRGLGSFPRPHSVRGGGPGLIALVNGLGHGGPKMVAALLKRLQPKAETRATWILCAINRAGSDAVAVFSRVIDLLGHKNPDIANAALCIAWTCATEVPPTPKSTRRLLSRLRSEKAVDPMLRVELRRHLPTEASRILTAALSGSTPVKRRVVREISKGVEASLANGLGRNAWVSNDRWLPCLNDPDPIVRRVAIGMLTIAQSERVGTHILDVATSDPRWDIRVCAIRGLRSAPQAEHIEAGLFRCLADPDRFVRAVAIEVLRNRRR